MYFLIPAAPYTGLSKHGDNMPLIIILTVSIIGMILLGLNVLLILFFIRRRRKKMEKGKGFMPNFSKENDLSKFKQCFSVGLSVTQTAHYVHG